MAKSEKVQVTFVSAHNMQASSQDVTSTNSQLEETLSFFTQQFHY